MAAFDTLKQQRQALAPSTSGPHHERLAALPLPHIDSFNNLFDNKSLIASAIADIPRKRIHDAMGNSLDGWCSCPLLANTASLV